MFSIVDEGATGNGGNISVTTKQLLVTQGSQIAVSTAGSGNGGILDIKANNVELIGSSDFGSSGLFSNAIIDSGDGGDINLTSDRLTILDGATINASNFPSRGDAPPGQGKAGNILINANSLNLDRVDSKIPSSITASTNDAGGGQIFLNVVDKITLHNDSKISANARGQGNAENIEINTNILELNTGSAISTSTFASGNAGKIKIGANTINLSESSINSEVSVSEVKDSATGDGGNIEIIAESFNLNNQAQVSVNSTGEGHGFAVQNNIAPTSSLGRSSSNSTFIEG